MKALGKMFKKRVWMIFIGIFCFSFFVTIVYADSDKKKLTLNPKEQATWELDLPLTIFDKSAGDWVVDRFAGNTTAGSQFYQGPAMEVGGLQRPDWCIEAEPGNFYLTVGLVGSDTLKLLKIDSKGTLRLFMEATGAIEGPIEACRSGYPIWNPKEKALYITGPNCLRKVVEKSDGSHWVKIVAGIPGKNWKRSRKPRNGPAKEATFQDRFKGIVCNTKGVFYWLEDNGLRQIKNGIVSSIPLIVPEEPKRMYSGFAMHLLSLGENDDTLYISDYYNPGYRIFRCDTKTGVLEWVCGINRLKEKIYRKKKKHRAGLEADGPALTHAGANSGMRGVYSPFYHAIFVGGPDHNRGRWLRMNGDGWVRTIFGAKRPGTLSVPFGISELNSENYPGEYFRFRHCHYAGIDSKGGLFIKGWADKSGVWRVYNKKEGYPLR